MEETKDWEDLLKRRVVPELPSMRMTLMWNGRQAKQGCGSVARALSRPCRL